MIGSLFGLLPFVQGLNYIWRMYGLGNSWQPSEEALAALDSYMASHKNFNWFSGFFPPTFPRYRDGVRV